MTSENTLTGRNGKVEIASTLVARVKLWTGNPNQATHSEWGDSDSQGYTNRAPGRRDFLCDLEGVYDSTNEAWDIFQPEDIAVVVLWLSNAEGTDLYWDLPRALCIDFNISINIDTEEVVGWTSNWGSDGIFYKPGDSPNDRTAPGTPA